MCMKELSEGVIRVYPPNENPENGGRSRWKIVQKAYTFPIKVELNVHNAIAFACDLDITRQLILARHKDAYPREIRDEKLKFLRSWVITSLLQDKENDETLEQIEAKKRKKILDLMSPCTKEAEALKFAFQMGEAVAYGHLTGRPYDADTTYLPSLDELQELSPTEKQITELAGFHAAWQTNNALTQNHANKSFFERMLEMYRWGAYDFRFQGNDFSYEIS